MSEPAAESSDPVSRVYFPELDGLRFFAFLFVFLFHGGLDWQAFAGLFGRGVARSFRENGWVGVQLFFILSGYLITTLLLREELQFGRIDLKAFWVRRALRIWPLYYLTVVLTFLVIPWLSGELAQEGGRANVARHLPAFLAFAGNWSMAVRGPVTSDAQSILWSVCVEEQFYLVVPLLVAWVGRRWRVGVVAALMLGSLATRAYLAKTGANQLWLQYNTFAQFDTLLAGVMLALGLGPDPKAGHARLGPALLQWPLYVASAWLFSRPELGHVVAWRRTWDFVAIWAAGVGIVAVAVTVPGFVQRALAYPRLVWLGKISYGLYMYHEIAFRLRDRFALLVGWFPNQDWILSIGGLGLTVALAGASYRWVERPFLRLKRGWTRVESRPV